MGMGMYMIVVTLWKVRYVVGVILDILLISRFAGPVHSIASWSVKRRASVILVLISELSLLSLNYLVKDTNGRLWAARFGTSPISDNERVANRTLPRRRRGIAQPGAKVAVVKRGKWDRCKRIGRYVSRTSHRHGPDRESGFEHEDQQAKGFSSFLPLMREVQETVLRSLPRESGAELVVCSALDWRASAGTAIAGRKFPRPMRGCIGFRADASEP